MQVGIAPVSVGFIIAIIVLVVAIALVLIGQLPLTIGVLIAALAAARLT